MSFDLELSNNDLKINANGQISTITDTPKLRQDIIKIILTDLGSNKFQPWYGCNVNSCVIGKVMSPHISDAQIQESVLNALQNLQKLQKSQSATQKMSLAEIIRVISDIHAERDVSDSRKINIVVTVLTQRLSQVQELFTLIS